MLHNAGASKKKKRASTQDSRRIGFLKRLLLEAKQGDLIVVPLGKGLDAEVAIGEFETPPGIIRKVKVEDGDQVYVTWGRPIKWRTTGQRRRRFSNALNKSLQAPAAFHLIEKAYIEEVYLAAYGSFTYDDIYVASFPSTKSSFTTTDQARIGIWFNALAVIHQSGLDGQAIDPNLDFVDVGLYDSAVDLELVRNSPISAIVRTVGPLAFSLLSIYPLALEAKPLSAIAKIEVSAKAVTGATDSCNVIIPPDLAVIAKGLGHGRWERQCRLAKSVHDSATLKSNAHLKNTRKKRK